MSLMETESTSFDPKDSFSLSGGKTNLEGESCMPMNYMIWVETDNLVVLSTLSLPWNNPSLEERELSTAVMRKLHQEVCFHQKT
jgi:hypothetical protein